MLTSIHVSVYPSTQPFMQCVLNSLFVQCWGDVPTSLSHQGDAKIALDFSAAAPLLHSCVSNPRKSSRPPRESAPHSYWN